MLLGLEEEAEEVFREATDAYDRTRRTDEVLEGIEEVLDEVGDSIEETRENVAQAEEAVDAAQEKCKGMTQSAHNGMAVCLSVCLFVLFCSQFPASLCSWMPLGRGPIS